MLNPDDIGRLIRAFRWHVGWTTEKLAEQLMITEVELMALESGQWNDLSPAALQIAITLLQELPPDEGLEP